MARVALITALIALATVGCAQETPKASPANGNVAANTSAAQADTDRAVLLISRKQFDEAQTILQRAIAADPMYGPAHNDLGIALQEQNRLYESAIEFRDAAKLMPRQPQPLNNLGLVLESGGKFREAEQYYTHAVELDRDNTEYAGNLARARIRLGERDQITSDLLVRIILHDRRPEWVAWAQQSLAAMAKTTAAPASQP